MLTDDTWICWTPFIRSDDEDDTPATEEVKKPKVIVDNKPLTRINCADDDEVKPETSNAVNQNQEKKKKKKKKKNKNKNSNDTAKSAAPVAAQSTGVTDTKSDLVKTEQIKPAPKTQLVPQPLKSAERKTSKIVKVQAKQTDRLSKVAHKTIDKRNKHTKQNKSKSLQLSDERLKAFGINPKKFVKQQKYAARNNQQVPIATNKKPQAIQSKQKIKLKNKLKKVLKAPKWAKSRCAYLLSKCIWIISINKSNEMNDRPACLLIFSFDFFFIISWC